MILQGLGGWGGGGGHQREESDLGDTKPAGRGGGPRPGNGGRGRTRGGGGGGGGVGGLRAGAGLEAELVVVGPCEAGGEAAKGTNGKGQEWDRAREPGLGDPSILS